MEFGDEACLTAPRRHRVVLRVVVIEAARVYLRVAYRKVRERGSHPGRRFVVFREVRQDRGNVLLSLMEGCERFMFDVGHFLCFHFQMSNFFRGAVAVDLFRDPNRSNVRLLLYRLVDGQDYFLFPFFLRRAELRMLHRVFVGDLFHVFLRA